MARTLSHSDLTHGNTQAGDTFGVRFTFPAGLKHLDFAEHLRSELGELNVTELVSLPEQITLRATVPTDGAALDLIDLITSSPVEDDELGSINYEFLD